MTTGGSKEMRRLLARSRGWRLQYILIIGFVLTTAFTIAVGALITYGLINNYLIEAQDARVGRDMELATAFYNSKLDDLAATAGRVSSVCSVRENLPEVDQGVGPAAEAIEAGIDNELRNLPPGTQRFVIVTDSQGRAIAGRLWSRGTIYPVELQTDWSSLPIVQTVISQGELQAATEVLPAQILRWLGLEGQGRIRLIDTPKAAPEPFDARESTAGLVLMGAAPILSEQGEVQGAVVAGHLFNNDFTLVDRIKKVAGVDTATIFFGDLRVSTNVLDEQGDRAIGTRVSQEVFDRVLVQGEEFTGDAFVVNQWYITRYQPLYDHLGRVVGMLYVGAQQSAFQRLVDSFARQVFFIAVATILLAILIAIPLSWSISRPLAGLASATHRVALGDWSVRVRPEGYAEMRTLAHSFNTMVESLNDAQEQLVQKEKLASVGQLAAGVAHEINNPLGSVLLYADILHRETPEGDQQQRDDLQMIIKEATRCKTIVNDLLNFSRQNEILAQETDVNRMLEEIAEQAGKQDLFRNIEITTDLDPNLGTIQADPLQLHQVFTNLVNNAAEAMSDGGQMSLRTCEGSMPGYISVEVTDTGHGIPEENMSRLFTPFFTTKPIGKGTGLGLAITYGIVKMHRGQISVQSKVGQGTTFVISLQRELPADMWRPAGSPVSG
jgi:two-component system NtrC family sensor kinase